ncbi:MAG TPA: tripartite tricarboxylate transporter substrate-binding protein [Chloroflexota bacterium]|nr:tripartite tricarboxylate transporter substrate-binding protein [Chloroflexota bacterium]
MRRLLITMAMAAIVSSLAIAGCSQGAAPAASQASPTAAKAAEPTKATAASPTKASEPTKAATAPAKTTSFPEKGKSVSLIVGYAAGGGADIGARVLASPLEKELGTPVQVINKAGAGTQVSTTFVAQSKPDGYTVGYSNWPNMITIYMDPERKATYGRKDLQPIAMHLVDPMAIAVKGDSPYKDLKDLIQAAKDKPKEIKIGTTGKLAIEHLVFLKLQEEVGVKFTFVHFDGTAPGITALLGGHIDAIGGGFSSVLPTAKAGQTRVLASMDKGGDAFLPGTKSLEDLGYKGYFGVSRGWFVPAGTPKDVVNVLTNGIKKSMETEEHKTKIKEIGQMPMFMGPDEMATYWDNQDTWVKPLMALAAKDE